MRYLKYLFIDGQFDDNFIVIREDAQVRDNIVYVIRDDVDSIIAWLIKRI